MKSIMGTYLPTISIIIPWPMIQQYQALSGEKGDRLILLGVPGFKIQVPTGGWEGIRRVAGPISGRIF